MINDDLYSLNDKISQQAASQSVYLDHIVRLENRIVSLLDKTPFSSRLGSFSRTHWAWKFSDRPYPRLQEGAFTLAFLSRHYGALGNHRKKEFYEVACRSAIVYWQTLQNSNGSFDEAYPFEQCLAATAFTTFYVGSAFEIIQEVFSEAEAVAITKSLSRAAQWLCDHDETHGILSNHLASAVGALQVVGGLTKRSEFKTRARFFLDRIFLHQSSEGWMKEYEGADIGYGTHTFFYLGDYWQRTGCEETLGRLKKFSEFLKYFIHPDGSLGGTYSSRNTEFYYPAGFEIISPQDSISQAIAHFMQPSIASQLCPTPSDVDTYNFFPLLNNYIFAHINSHLKDAANALPLLPCQSAKLEIYFEECGIWVLGRPNTYIIVGVGKGGTIDVFDKRENKLSLRHSGYWVSRGQQVWASQDYTPHKNVRWIEEFVIEFEVPWKSFKIPVFTPVKFMIFRAFNITLGRSAILSALLKKILVRVLIHRKSAVPLKHSRRISFTDESLIIKDVICTKRLGPLKVNESSYFTTIHMGSSAYADVRNYQFNENSFVFKDHCEMEIRFKDNKKVVSALLDFDSLSDTNQ